jgi:sodium transport system ATP-binding protein
MIAVDHLCKEFGPPTKVHRAVSDLSFQVTPGEVYALLGPNGAGKTTTLRMILGLLSPTSGEVHVNGLPVTRHADAVKQQIGLVSASAGLYQWLTPRETLQYFADLYGVPRDQAAERLQSLAQLLDLHRFLDQRSATLSTGQKQRVTLARALMHDPPVMLLDEPTRGLDIVGSHVIFEYLTHLKSLGKAVILCTHRLDEASQVSNRLGLLHRGQLRHEGTFSQLKAQTGCETLYEMFLQLLQEPAQTEGHPG